MTSSASCAPCQGGKTLHSTSMLLACCTGAFRISSIEAMCLPDCCTSDLPLRYASGTCLGEAGGDVRAVALLSVSETVFASEAAGRKVLCRISSGSCEARRGLLFCFISRVCRGRLSRRHWTWMPRLTYPDTCGWAPATTQRNAVNPAPHQHVSHRRPTTKLPLGSN